MCTVTFLPLNKRDFMLTSNRDEDISRPVALPVQQYVVAERTIYFPKDPKGNGSWIAYDAQGYTLCLLNGAYKPHRSKGNYRKSRGIMLLDFYAYGDPKTFAADYDFSNIEPFTLIMAYSCSDTDSVLLYELKWDETEARLNRYDASLPHIWSSVTLYAPEIIRQRDIWFNEWLEKKNEFSTDQILFFHHFGGVGENEIDLVMNRGKKKTVSICCINKTQTHTEIIYEDIVNKKLYHNKIIPC
jgi:hypothetical protein